MNVIPNPLWAHAIGGEPMTRRGVVQRGQRGGMRRWRPRSALAQMALVAVMMAVAAIVAGMPPTAGVDAAKKRGEVGTEIVGGGPVPNGKYPFMVSLQDVRFGGPGARHLCGGSLVAPDVVVTAAHCTVSELTSTETLRVVVGRTSLNGNQGQERRVVTIRIHPDYRARTSVYDVAVLELDRPIEGIEPIRLATRSDRLDRAGQEATVAGWGSTQLQPGPPFQPPRRVPSRMQETTVPVRSDASCARAYAGRPSLPGNDIVPAIMLCAGSAGRDTCQGDSGGPMFVRTGGGYIQIGVTSFGVGCGASGFPGVYTQVSASAIRNFVEESFGQAP